MRRKIVMFSLVLLVAFLGWSIYKANQADQAAQIASGYQTPWDQNGEYVVPSGPEAGFHVVPNSTAARDGLVAFAVILLLVSTPHLIGAAFRRGGVK